MLKKLSGLNWEDEHAIEHSSVQAKSLKQSEYTCKRKHDADLISISLEALFSNFEIAPDVPVP
jgi:hypothetical protein